MLDSDLKHPKAGVRKSDALLLRKIAKITDATLSGFREILGEVTFPLY